MKAKSMVKAQTSDTMICRSLGGMLCCAWQLTALAYSAVCCHAQHGISSRDLHISCLRSELLQCIFSAFCKCFHYVSCQVDEGVLFCLARPSVCTNGCWRYWQLFPIKSANHYVCAFSLLVYLCRCWYVTKVSKKCICTVVHFPVFQPPEKSVRIIA